MASRPPRLVALFLIAMTPMLGAALAEDPPPPICPAIDPPVSAAAPPDAGLRAFRDPLTGELRSPTAEELTRAREAREFAPKASQVFTTTVRADGTKSVDLGDAFLFDVVATRAPDGTVRVRCVPRSGARAGSAAEVK